MLKYLARRIGVGKSMQGVMRVMFYGLYFLLLEEDYRDWGRRVLFRGILWAVTGQEKAFMDYMEEIKGAAGAEAMPCLGMCMNKEIGRAHV